MTDFAVRRLTTSFGAELIGVDVRTLHGDGLARLRNAIVEHGVVFVRDQPLTDDEHLGLARHFGSLSVYPVLRLAGQERPLEFIEDTANDPPKADRWHSDITWLNAPPMFGFLSMQITPEHGGDTMWADTQAALTALSPTFQQMLRGLRVIHRVEPASFDRFEERFGPNVGARFRDEFRDGVEHPLVRRNPDSGREALFLGGYWMHGIAGMHQHESDTVLAFLMAHATAAERTLRWHWRVDDLAIWDERRTMHLAMGDHYPRHRKVRRCTVDGEVPLSA